MCPTEIRKAKPVAQGDWALHKLVTMSGPRILLVVGGGIAAYKSCELVRLIRRHGGEVTCVLTNGGAQFVTPMTLAALSENPVYTSLWDLKNEVEMGHIQLSRQADLIVVCPATADLLAKMTHGIADDLATTLLLATDKPVMAIPAMNVRMWEHAATQANVTALRERGIAVMEPDEGPMACGEFGPGRLPEPTQVMAAICDALSLEPLPMLVPELTWEPEAPDDGASFSLGGLSGGLIQRSTNTRILFEDQVPPEDAEIEDLAPGDDFVDGPAPMTPLPDPVPGDAGPILVKKGKARAAPPTDAEAINHLVMNQTPPEPLRGDAPEPAPEQVLEPRGADPLVGQPDFEEEPAHRPLFGKHVLITAGPTHEPIDPVRYIANRSSGKQGFAIAAAAARAGARVTLVSGPVALPTPPGVDRIDVVTAREMAEAVRRSLPADAAVMVAAVADWRTEDEEARLSPAGAAADREPGYPGDGLAQRQAAQAGCRFRGRDRAGAGARQGQAQAQGCGLDCRQRRFGQRDGRGHEPRAHRFGQGH
jgi:phosphopantothenoylcysteine decarboxylase/phosphopantothenate--cysteine ligase